MMPMETATGRFLRAYDMGPCAAETARASITGAAAGCEWVVTYAAGGTHPMGHNAPTL
jgi:hypothetical protein